MHILESLEEAPPVIFCVRSWPSSVFSSSSCLRRSSLDLPQRALALTFPEDDCRWSWLISVKLIEENSQVHTILTD